MEFSHQPVLLNEVIAGINLKTQGIYVDCTLGGAGHSLAMLTTQPDIFLVGIDQDPTAIGVAQQRLARFRDQVKVVQNNFRYLDEILSDLQIDKVDGILLDVGVSSHQLDHGERGFSYQQDAALDMRMNPEQNLNAYTIVNTYPVDRLADIIWKYGEERWSSRIAQFIGESRETEPIKTTGELVTIIKAAIPKKARIDGPHPAKRTFQALRIAVNDELGALEDTLNMAVSALKPQGRLCVISFHSLEDRIVKNAFAKLNNPCTCPPGFPVCACGKQPRVKVITRKPITASVSELNENPRARSAKLRICERIFEEA